MNRAVGKVFSKLVGGVLAWDLKTWTKAVDGESAIEKNNAKIHCR